MNFNAALRRTFEPLAQKMTRVGPLGRMSYSAAGEDRLVLGWLQAVYHRDIRQVRYCDIGANHPTKLSNTFLLYSMGASGVLVEPDPDLCGRLRRKRPNDVVLNVGMAFDERRLAKLTRLKASVFNTFSSTQAEQVVIASKDWQPYQRQTIIDEIEVALTPANDILEKYFSDGIDFVSIDTEGVDLPILKSIDLQRFRPRMICIEATANFDPILEPAGYQLTARTPDNVIYRLV
jgi:FkbM family methyltransferase